MSIYYKICACCKQSKDSTQFVRNKNRKDGYHSYCKACVKIRSDAFYKSNSAYYVDYHLKHQNPQRNRERKAEWRKSNLAHCAAQEALRRCSKLQRTPKWLTSEQKNLIEQFYIDARFQNLHVDHIIPLQGKYVSGLHVPWNLQLLTPEENLSKGNRIK